MRRLSLLALPAALLVPVALVPMGASASIPSADASSEIVLDLPPDFVRYGTELPLTGTVFDGEGRRAARNPVAVASWNQKLDEHVWGKTVTTDANGRFRTTVRADGSVSDAVLVAPLLNGPEGAALAQERVPANVKVLYPVTVRIAKDAATGGLSVKGTTPECDEASLQLEYGSRGSFQAHGEPFNCVNGTFAAVVERPGAAQYQYRVVRAADADGVRSVSSVVSFR